VLRTARRSNDGTNTEGILIQAPFSSFGNCSFYPLAYYAQAKYTA
jgi:hypothetical protein